jgi:autotransporter-associated beta strand protein
MSGAGNLAKTGAGNLVLSGANTYTGSTTISAGRLQLGAANTIASSSSVIMAGGTLDPDGFHHVMSGTLSLTANSTIDYTSGTAEIDFADSSAATWTAGKTLNLVSTGGGNWNTSGDELNFNENPIGLDGVRLSQIEFNGTDLGDAAINDNGFIFDSAQPIPEPSTIVLSLLGGLGLLWNIRRRTV